MTEKTLREIALASVPPELREAVLAYAAEHGVTHANDPYWPIVASMANGMAAARAAGEAAGAVKTAIGTIPDAIYLGTTKAGADLGGQVADAGAKVIAEAETKASQIQAGLTAAITQAAQSSSAVINKAIAGLGTAAESRKDELTREMQAAAAIAARDQIRAGVAGRMARSWGVVAFSLLLALLIGAAGTFALADFTGHLLPPGRALVPGSDKKVCGAIQGKDEHYYNVCLTRRFRW